MMRQFQFADRQLITNPDFSVGAVLTLALAIGANAFSIINAVLLPLPYPHADRIVVLYESSGPGQDHSFAALPSNFPANHKQSL